MIYYIDFDGTICPNSGNPPQKECIEVLKRLKETNNTIYIYSCRANPQAVTDVNSAIADMVSYLEEFKVPYDGIVPNKPFFNYYIDDRCVGVPLTPDHSVDWSRIQKLLDT